MKKLIILFLIVFLIVPVIVEAGQVRGYRQDRDGDGYKETPVRPHYRTNPDGNPYNNYSSPGQFNPNTGRITTGNPDTYGSQHKSKGLWGD